MSVTQASSAPGAAVWGGVQNPSSGSWSKPISGGSQIHPSLIYPCFCSPLCRAAPDHGSHGHPAMGTRTARQETAVPLMLLPRGVPACDTRTLRQLPQGGTGILSPSVVASSRRLQAGGTRGVHPALPCALSSPIFFPNFYDVLSFNRISPLGSQHQKRFRSHQIHSSLPKVGTAGFHSTGGGFGAPLSASSPHPIAGSHIPALAVPWLIPLEG